MDAKLNLMERLHFSHCARLTELDDCGQLVFFERPDGVLDAVSDLAEAAAPMAQPV